MSAVSLDNVGTHVPCHVYGHVYAGVYACPGLFLPSWGDIKKRGRGRIGSISEKRPQNINAWTESGWRSAPQGKRQRVRAKVRDGGNPIERCQGKSFLQETSVMPGQMPTHVYGQDSTHVPTHV